MARSERLNARIDLQKKVRCLPGNTTGPRQMFIAAQAGSVYLKRQGTSRQAGRRKCIQFG